MQKMLASEKLPKYYACFLRDHESQGFNAMQVREDLK